jgi:glycosyltransferase involved in cell wall biosynthesis
MNTPKVSVIMAVYNGQEYIVEAIESLLNQTMADFELIIVDNASEDNTVHVVEQYKDPRIRLLRNEINKGSIFSRNRAVQESRASYLAILDSDDVALPQRLEKEVMFLDSHPDFGVVGTGVQVIDGKGQNTKTVWINTLPAEMIPAILLFQNYFANSSVMFRKEAMPNIQELYREMNPADDYDLWLRLDKKWKMWNLPEVLAKYRVHGNNMTFYDSDRGREKVRQMVTEALAAKLGITPTEEEYQIHRTNFGFEAENPKSYFDKRESWLLKLKKQNDKIQYYNSTIFSKVLADRWLSNCSSNTRFGFWTWKRFWQSPLTKGLDKKENLKPLLKFFIKCLLKKDPLKTKN